MIGLLERLTKFGVIAYSEWAMSLNLHIGLLLILALTGAPASGVEVQA